MPEHRAITPNDSAEARRQAFLTGWNYSHSRIGIWREVPVSTTRQPRSLRNHERPVGRDGLCLGVEGGEAYNFPVRWPTKERSLHT